MDWIQPFIIWYVYSLLIAVAFAPLAARIFPRTVDGGYAYARIIGIMLMSYVCMALGVVKLLPFTREVLLLGLAAVAVVSYRPILREGQLVAKLEQMRSRVSWIFISELIFMGGLLAWTIVRGQEPSIRGLEKFMDYGFIQSIGRAQYFPPLDMWYSAQAGIRDQGYYINYYYFGHLTGALLVKLSGVLPQMGYNLILANIFGLALSACFSLVVNIISMAEHYVSPRAIVSRRKLVVYGLLGALLVNLAGNAHTIYLFTRGYPNESPKAPWDKDVRAPLLPSSLKLKPGTVDDDIPKDIVSALLYRPQAPVTTDMQPGQSPPRSLIPDPIAGLQRMSSYWYPNATRFIPNTIHEFPSYSYIVADLHGHVFDIPFVLLTIMFIVMHITPHIASRLGYDGSRSASSHSHSGDSVHWLHAYWRQARAAYLHYAVILGFMCAIHYMTNAFDGILYLFISGLMLLLLGGFTLNYVFTLVILGFTFLYFSLPFSLFFEPFASGVGLNCGSQLFRGLMTQSSNVVKIGPLLIEQGKCQLSEGYQMIILWGYFWLHAIVLSLIVRVTRSHTRDGARTVPMDIMMMVFFAIGTLFILIPELLYIKDIYPTHFRANTLFKMGYQAYILMSVASLYTIWRLRAVISPHWRRPMRILSVMMTIMVLIYIRPALTAYYGQLDRKVSLNGISWLKESNPDSYEIVEYLNTRVPGQPVILEAQGDSYTDYDVVSAYTGLPTVAGWWVHEWLWRGGGSVKPERTYLGGLVKVGTSVDNGSQIVGERIPDIEKIYRSEDIDETRALLRKYKVEYVIVSEMERKKYETDELKIVEKKFGTDLGRRVFRSSDGKGAVYKID